MNEPPVAPWLNILGTKVNALSLDDAVGIIARWVERGERRYVCVRDVHGIVRAVDDAELRAIHHAAGMVTPDGVPLVVLARLRGFANVTRVYGPDLMMRVLELSLQTGFSHYFYGTTQETLAALSQRLTAQLPGLKIAGMMAPPFRELNGDERLAVAAAINRSGARVVWVGLGTPKQERWMAGFRPLLEAPVLVGVGAAFDFHAGRVRQAPAWMQKIALEWLFRLAMEPRRLWRRYVYNIPRFLYLITLEWLGLRKSALEDK
jgi:N-acetylglucosaminyldiphosphoundecaprenol N-acetyl-beta-D-mannosaminyltransferase